MGRWERGLTILACTIWLLTLAGAIAYAMR
jgi:hypothetical protein